MFTHFTDIINGLTYLGKIYTNTEIIRKVLRSLPKSWETKVIAITETKDLSKLSLDELMGSLLTHELIMKEMNEEKDNKKKKGIAFKTIATCEEEDEENSEFDDEEIAFLKKRFQKFMKKNQERRRFFKRDFNKGEYSRKDFIKEKIIRKLKSLVMSVTSPVTSRPIVRKSKNNTRKTK